MEAAQRAGIVPRPKLTIQPAPEAGEPVTEAVMTML
jgi:hypothetical protein